MKFCVKCGKELSENAKCTCCDDFEAAKLNNHTSEKKPNKILCIMKSKITLCIAAVLLVLSVLAFVLYMPRDIEMDDIKKCNEITEIIQYGVPRIRENNTFYGVKPMSWSVDDDSLTFFFYEEDAQYIYYKIESECEFYRNIGNSFHEFKYGNLRITTYDYSGSYVNIEIK